MPSVNVINSQTEWNDLPRKERLALLDEYYGNNSLYEAMRVMQYYMGYWNENIRPLRTPVHRAVEFHVSKIAVGEPTITSDNQSVADAVGQIMSWSNFQIQKPVQVRTMAKYGDVFRKVASGNGKVWHEVIKTSEVCEFEEDARGFLTEIRIDTPVMENNIPRTRTEYWTVNVPTPYMAVWIHRLPENSTIEQIQKSVDPIIFEPLAAFGIDFIPFVRSPFQSNGTNEWGSCTVEHALLKIDEANRQSTRLHQMLFRYGKPLWTVSANQVLPDGSPIPAPKFKNGTNSDKTNLEMRDDSILELPGMAELKPLVPAIDYKAALDILLSQEKELQQDLPELLYYALPERADLSGKAIRTLLGGAVDRALQAQSNFLEGTVRLNQMCLSVGTFLGVFPAMGNFDDGSLDHALNFSDPFPMDDSERSAALQAYTSAGLPLSIAMKKVGFSDEEITTAMAEKDKEDAKQQNDLANSMLAFNRA